MQPLCYMVTTLIMYRIAGKLGGMNVWRIYSFQAFGKKVWQMNRSANGLLIVTTSFDDFSLANHRQFAEFTKLSTHQTFLL